MLLKREDIKQFTLGVENCYFMWKVVLLDDNIYQVKYRIEEHITAKGNKSKRKIYFIRKNETELIFDNEVKQIFWGFRRPYIMDGI